MGQQAAEQSDALLNYESVFGKFPTSTRFVRIQWVDITNTVRLRVLPISTVKKRFPNLRCDIALPTFFLLHDDAPIPGCSPTGMHSLSPAWGSLRSTAIPDHLSLWCDIHTRNTGKPVNLCPRSNLQAAISYVEKSLDMSLLIGFETEFVLLDRLPDGSLQRDITEAHAWSSFSALTPQRTQIMDEIVAVLEAQGIDVVMYHPESADGQFEVVTGPLPPLEAVDALYLTRQTIVQVARKYNVRATLHPKPYSMQAGNACHTHFSVLKGGEGGREESFVAGILEHLEAVTAFGCASMASYERKQDSCWSGGNWIGYGDENREVPLRRILPAEEAKRWEIRSVDGTANIYLFLAAMFYAGALGIQDALKLSGKCEVNPAVLTEEERKGLGLVRKMPSGLGQALDHLRNDQKLAALLGRELCDHYIVLKKAEIEKIAAMEPEQRWVWESERY